MSVRFAFCGRDADPPSGCTLALRTINKNGAYRTLVDAGLIKPLRPKAPAAE